jgi:hypothetical protein
MTLKEKTLEELHELYAHKLQMVRQAEEDIVEIRNEIRARDPKFDFMDIFEPIDKLLDGAKDEKYRDEVGGDPIQEFLRSRDK